jgi:hypothetical protein
MHDPSTPPPPQPAIAYAPYTETRDADHLRLLSIFHYVYGGLTAVFSCIFIIHIVIGVMMISGKVPFPNGPGSPNSSAPPAGIGWLFIGMGSAIILVGWTLAALTIVSGRCIARRKARTFSMVVAGVNCLSVPLGTTLGVFTFIVLLRESVAAAYASTPRGIPDGVGRPPVGYN